MKDLNSIFCVFVKYHQEIQYPRGFFLTRLEGETTFAPRLPCFKREKQTKKRWEDEHRKLIIAADAHVGWKKVNCMGWYSTDLAFTQRKPDIFFKNERSKADSYTDFRKASETSNWLVANLWQCM